MKALLLADFYIILRYTRAFLAAVVLFLVISVWGTSSSFLVIYPVLMASILPTSILSYNERFHWDSFCETLPISRAQAVSEKYVLTLLLTGIVFILTALLQLSLVLRNMLSLKDYFSMLDILVVFAFLIPSAMLPIIFKFGMERGRMAYYVVFGAAFACTVFLPDRLIGSAVVSSGPLMLFILLAVCAVMFVVSWQLSIKFYEKRDL